MKPNQTTVLIVDDHPVVREGLTVQISMQPDLQVCAEAEDIPSAMAAVEKKRPDVAVIDISLKNGSGLELIKRLHGRDDTICFASAGIGTCLRGG